MAGTTMISRVRLYRAALGTIRRRYDRETRFDPVIASGRVRLEPERHERWARVVGHAQPASMLPPWLFVVGQQALLDALTDPSFPFPVVGMIHLGNHSMVTAAPPWHAELRLEVRISHAGLRPAGHVISMETGFFHDDRAVGVNRSTALVPCRNGPRSRRAGPAPSSAPAGIELLFGERDGRRYARVSGDWNPIHLSHLFARHAGFERPIAHGMYAAARIAALLDAQRLPARRSFEVEYLRPTLLPSRTVLTRRHTERGTAFALHAADSDRPLLRGIAT